MKFLSRGTVAFAVGLLVSTGLATPAHAAETDCVVSIADKSAEEGDTGTSLITFTVTATPDVGVPTGCDGKTISYAFGGGEATKGTGADYTATDDTLTFATATGPRTEEISATIIGDTTIEPDETFTVTLSEPGAGNPDLSIADTTATGTIVNDDFLREGAALTISPTSGPAGTAITVSGTGCEAPTVDVALAASSGQSGSVVAEKKDVAVSGTTDRTFSTTITIPAGSDPALTYTVGAACGSDAYAFKTFDVTAAANVPTGASGYRMVAADGGIFTFGDRVFRGSTGNLRLNKPIVGGATDTSDFDGYWIVASDGGVFTFNAGFFGSLAGQALPAPAVEIEPTSTGKGYWIVLANGKVHNFGDAKHFGDFAGNPLNKPVIGMSVTTTGQGYWIVAQDGGIFSFGDAKFFGSTGNKTLNAPIIDLAPAVDNKGYYLLGADGGVFSFGSADFKGSTGNLKLNAPVVAMLVAPTGAGYWLAASDGGLFTFGAVNFMGSMGGTKLNSPVLDLIN